MAAVDMCMYVGTDLQTKVRAPSPEPDVISCCAVIRTFEKVGTPGTYMCRTRGLPTVPPSHPSPPSPSPSGSVWIQGVLERKGFAQPKPTSVSRCDPPLPSIFLLGTSTSIYRHRPRRAFGHCVVWSPRMLESPGPANIHIQIQNIIICCVLYIVI